MKFIDVNHKKSYSKAMTKYGVDPRSSESSALLYLLTATCGCRCKLEDLIEQDDWLIIKPDALQHDWITSGDARIIRLAYNLYTGGAPTAMTWVPETESYHVNHDEVWTYLPQAIIGGVDPDLFEACLEALRIYRGRTNSCEEEYIADANERLWLQKYERRS